MYKYNKNDNMTKELVWSSGQCFPVSLERLRFESWLLQFACNIIWGLVLNPMGLGFESWLLQFACNIIWGLVLNPMGLGSSPS